jgi:arginase
MRPFLGAPIDPARFRYFGAHIGDDGDWALQRELDLKLLDSQASVGGPVHIHFDLDVLDPREFPYVAYPDGNIGIDEAIALVARIAREADIVGLTVTEFAPSDDDEAHKGSQVIARICEAAIRS